MIARGSRKRSGITLTEILIAILIMGVGMISLATLFPLGLLRLREATRNSRSGLTFETAAEDMDTRLLFDKQTFFETWYGQRDPFVQDALTNRSYNQANAANAGVIASGNPFLPNNNVGLSTGLPFCYDPLWRSITGVFPNSTLASPYLDFQLNYVAHPDDEVRFGAGVFANRVHPYLRNDVGSSDIPSAYGLQRLTNFIPWSNATLASRSYPFTCINQRLLSTNALQPADVAGDVFTSIDDIVFNSTDANIRFDASNNQISGFSSVLPDISTGAPQADYRYTWFFTGHQLDPGGNGSQFAGEIVVCDGRPFGYDPVPGTNVGSASGEAVVEAVYGVAGSNAAGGSIVPLPAPNAAYGYAPSDRSVLIRWPKTMADPTVRVGGWICDVTYERNAPIFRERSINSNSVFARCHWYQVSKRTEPEDETAASSLPSDPGDYRRMVLTLSSPLKVKTLLNTSNGTPVHLNVALVMPSVINVFPRSFEVR